MKQLHIVWFGKDKGVSVPQVDMEEGSLNILVVTLTAMADFHKKRRCQQGNGV